MKQYNRLLLRQIQRKFGSVDELPPEMLDLIESISSSYDHFEKDRALIERSMDLSSQELIEAKELAGQAEELSRSNAELKQFAYVISHDLKEPLRSISSFVQLLQRKEGDKLSPESIEYIEYVVKGVHRMKRLLEDLMDYSLISERKSFEKKPLKLSKVVDSVCQNLFTTIESSNAVVSYNGLPEVVGNETQILQLFQNLIDNSIKFKSDEAPTIRIDYENLDEEHVKISVMDNGIGIEKQFKHKVFNLFHRLHKQEEFRGTGLGLAICKKIVEFHGGEIWINEQYNDGLKIEFTLEKGLE